MSKGKKQTRNKARDMFTDYYRTNREYDQENRRRQEAEGKKSWSGTEKLYAVIIVIGLAAIVVKYLVL